MNQYDKIKDDPEFIEIKQKSIKAYEEFKKVSEELERKFPPGEGYFWAYHSNGIPMIYSKGLLTDN